MGSVKKIEKILEEAIEENAKMSMSISYENKISEHIILNAWGKKLDLSNNLFTARQADFVYNLGYNFKCHNI